VMLLFVVEKGKGRGAVKKENKQQELLISNPKFNYLNKQRRGERKRPDTTRFHHFPISFSPNRRATGRKSGYPTNRQKGDDTGKVLYSLSLFDFGLFYSYYDYYFGFNYFIDRETFCFFFSYTVNPMVAKSALV